MNEFNDSINVNIFNNVNLIFLFAWVKCDAVQ